MRTDQRLAELVERLDTAEERFVNHVAGGGHAV
jgi:hypothetical protein